MKPTRNYGTYEQTLQAHTVAMQNKWIARMGWDARRASFYIEYIGKAS